MKERVSEASVINRSGTNPTSEKALFKTNSSPTLELDLQKALVKWCESSPNMKNRAYLARIVTAKEYIKCIEAKKEPPAEIFGQNKHLSP